MDLRGRFKYETPCSSKKDIPILHMRYLSDSGVFSAQLSVPFVCRLQSKVFEIVTRYGLKKAIKIFTLL